MSTEYPGRLVKPVIATELEKAIEEVKERNEKEFGWQPKDVAEVPPAVPGQGAKL